MKLEKLKCLFKGHTPSHELTGQAAIYATLLTGRCIRCDKPIWKMKGGKKWRVDEIKATREVII
jgi:hypothetical protein